MSDGTAHAPATFDCARRQLLLGAGAAGVALLAAGCGSSGSSSSSSAGGTAGSGTAGSGASSSAAGSSGLIALKDVPSDAAVSVPVSTDVSQQGALLLTQSGGKLTALDATCTHRACKVAPSGSQLMCPCHGSQYTLTGQVTAGPAPSPLHTVAVKVVSEQVVLA